MVFPSATETFGNVVLESLASGTPVIGANAGGVKNILQHGTTGYLCNPKDTDAFCGAIEDLLDADSGIEKMGRSGREYALSQDWDAIFENLLGHYKDVLQAPPNKLLA
ncbi:D-inositol 3-phosphate glycosyltransferase [compost metagenome]